MMQWFRIASLSLAVATVGFLPLSAQPGGRGDTDGRNSVEKLEADLAKLRRQVRSLELRLEFEQWREFRSKGGFGKSRDGKGDDGSGRGFGPIGGGGGFGGIGGGGAFGPMGGSGGRMGSIENEKGQKGDQGQKGPSRSPGGSSSSGSTGGSTKGGPSSSLERKLDQIQRELEEIRRELRRR